MNQFARSLRPHIKQELARYRLALADGRPDQAFVHLERAHVLGQGVTRYHLATHWHMLCWELRYRRGRGAPGQLLRLVGALILTPPGLLPAGNTGGSNISAFKSMPVEPELAEILRRSRQA